MQRASLLAVADVIFPSGFGLDFLSSHKKFVALHRRFVQLAVLGGKILVHLQGIGELDGRFSILSAGLEAFAALQILLLAHIWITVTAGREKEGGRRGDNC